MDTVETLMERPLEDWGRLAASIPGWAVMPGLLDMDGDRYVYLDVDEGNDAWPNADDPATTGCLLSLLGEVESVSADPDYGWVVRVAGPGEIVCGRGSTIGRAAIAAAVIIGRWPKGPE